MSSDSIFSLYDGAPDSLLDICMNYIVNNLNCIATQGPACGCYKLRDDVILPAEICEKFLEVYQKNYRVNDNIANLFRDRACTHLNRVKLCNARVTIEGLRTLLEHKPKVVELVGGGPYDTQALLEIINSNSENLLSLKFPPHQDTNALENDTIVLSLGRVLVKGKPYLSLLQDAPKLQKLCVQCSSDNALTRFPVRKSTLLVLKHLTNLTYLELSDRTWAGRISGLIELKQLQTLIMPMLDSQNFAALDMNVIDWICTLKKLKHLDISQSFRSKEFVNPNEVLAKIVKSLPLLEYLDISGTNLAGTGAAVVSTVKSSISGEEQPVHCDIPGLVSRVNNPLEFLGLYRTLHGACKRHDIPAKKISGDANEEQILSAAVAYMERPSMLANVLNDLYYLFRYENNAYIGRALAIVLDAMEQHILDKHIQISGSATLFYIVKGKEKARIGLKLKRRIISALLIGMEEHPQDDTMMRNGCLTMCQFKIPNDVLFTYERVARLLLNHVVSGQQVGFEQRIAIYLLNSLACQVDGKQKKFLGDHGVIEKMLTVIEDRLSDELCDDVLEVAWSTMWNVTDETPENCERFLLARGMCTFLSCLTVFPDKEELLRNMMGLLGNVAEVRELRLHLMTRSCLTIFYELLNSSSDGIEVSYNAAGVLAHMLYDGPDAWLVDQPAREAVLERMEEVINRWDLYAERNINYRSFEPILGLLGAYHTPQCQHWAVWALANLTGVYPEKYVEMLRWEDGLLLKELLNHPAPYERIKDLGRQVLINCARYHYAASRRSLD